MNSFGGLPNLNRSESVHQPEPTLREKHEPFTGIPRVLCPPIPSPHCLGRPSSSPLPPPPACATPPCPTSPQEPRRPMIWSDIPTYPRQRSSRRRLSYPQVPVVCSPLSPSSYGSVTIEQSHMGSPLQRLANPQWSR
ncbi:hypothetical protein Q5P01_005487 [Channa striata]|uniref:Uncharacterized protein n=1 Tax=Channa striata TaxID=64152 RepID=A0AA88T7D9_CHASR|nr:hypothetical protein Q5P01_005487 [Channa striata]